MISVAEAREIIRRNTAETRVEELSLTDAAGRVLAQDITSLCDVPSFDNSAMDGFAFRLDQELSSYTIVDTVQAGKSPARSIHKGEAVRIFTGAPVPEGADTVVHQEITEVREGILSFDATALKQGMHIRRKGEQSLKGTVVAKAGTVITPGMVGLLASVGIATVPVYVLPKVAIINTGSELQEAGSPLSEYGIYNSNGPALQAYLKTMGIHADSYYAEDDRQVIQGKIEQALQLHDVVIVTGGISVGAYDFVKDCLFALGVRQLFYKVKQKPGKPLFAGKQEDKWVFALPGNPAAVITCFNQYVKPCIQTMIGLKDVWQNSTLLPLMNDYVKKPGLTHFVKARAEHGSVSILPGQDSFNLLAFAEANCFIELTEEQEIFEAGTPVQVYQW